MTIVSILLSSLISDARAETKRVALIFDDGPVPAQAPGFLALFAQRKIAVTFAYVGKTAHEHTETARASIAAGHEVVNHSFSHLHPAPLDDAALEHEVLGGQEAIRQACGVAPRWYWPPYLERDPRHPALTARAGIRIYEAPHLVSSDDWNRAVDAGRIRQLATTGVVDRTVILFHEWREETLQELPAILDELERQGCTFLTFSELAETGDVPNQTDEPAHP